VRDTAQDRVSNTKVFVDVFGASPIGIVVENLDGQPLFVNPAFCSFLGFSEEELHRKHCVDFSPPEDAEKDWALFQQLRAGVIDHYQLDKRYFRRDGSLVWGRLIVSLLKSGRSPRILAMVEDITQEKKAEEARFRHAAVFESSDDAIASGTLDGIILSWNTGAQKIYGYTEAEAIGKPISMLVPPEIVNEENKILEAVRAGGRIEHFETLRVTKTGKRINVSLIISPIKDSTGRVVGCSGIARDITERKLAEEALRASEERLRLAQQAARIGTFEWNIQTGANTWTPELEAIYGLPPGGFGGTQTAFENLVYPDDRAGVVALNEQALKTGQPTTGEWRVVWADGSIHWIAGRWQVFMNESGEPSRMVGINIDITDRKRAEQELSEANERLRLALEAGSAGGWDYDLKTGKNVWFGKAHEQLGMTPDETSGSRKEFWDRIHEDDRERVEHAIQVAKEKRAVYAEDVRVVWRDGTIHWLRSRGRFQYDTNGEAERSLGISLDITEQKLAEEARFRHAAIVESSEDAIISKNRDAVITSWNAGAERIFGYAESEALGEPITILIPPELQDEENRILEKLRAGERIEHYETIRVTKTGRKVEVSLSISPIKDSSGNIMGFSKIARDITKRKRAEQDLLSSEQRYRLLFERNVAGVAIANLDGRLLDCNGGWAHILGYESRDELLGRPASEFYFNPAERKPIVDELFEKQVLFSRELHLKRKDGTPVWVLFNAAVFHSDRDAPIVQATMIDISEWKRAEEALSGMTRKLIEAQEQERARIGRELHDDINQRLAMLALEIEQLKENPSEVETRAQELRKQITEISDDVQALSHDLHASKLEYLGVVSGIKSWCKEFGERQKMEIGFKSDVASALPLDVGRTLFRLLQEALHNASKHSSARRVDVQLREDSGEIHLIVSDTGRGFDVEAALQGKGLGLTSMRERARLVNGTIEIQSKPMGGTIIHVRVPLALGHKEQRAAG
jgi:PAS domain S-box-containing protein